VEQPELKHIAILGSTGSIGRQTLAVVEAMPEWFAIVALAAGNNVEELAKQIVRHHPELVSVTTPDLAANLAERLRSSGLAKLPEIQHGSAGMIAVATHPSAATLVSAAVGVVGLEATYAAVKAGKQVALSNKEVLVAAGEIVMAAAREAHVELLPVDSEHNAIHQCLRAGRHIEVKKLILTASGGPFRKTPLAEMAVATPERALAHPNWQMGRRITIDSATLVNKGFEVIEARWLFDMRPDQIEVVIHPQSTIHSMVEYVDGSILAQLGPTDMRMKWRWIGQSCAVLISKKYRRAGFPAFDWRWNRSASWAPIRARSTRRTKSRSKRFSTGEFRFPASPK
jgi:1-deoxy-D-xylulose-5-phosphate reductoisomerase